MTFKILFLSFSLLGVIGCGRGPLVTVCISDPAVGGLECVDHSHKDIFVPYLESKKYVCMPPEDFKTLVEWAKRHKSK